MNDFVYLWGEGRGGGFVVVVFVVGSLFGDLNKGKVDGIAGLRSKGVKVEMREESAVGTEGDGVGIGATTAPKNSVAIVCEV